MYEKSRIKRGLTVPAKTIDQAQCMHRYMLMNMTPASSVILSEIAVQINWILLSSRIRANIYFLCMNFFFNTIFNWENVFECLDSNYEDVRWL